MILRVIMTYPARTVDACKEMMRRMEHATHRPPARLRLPPITACASSFELPANPQLLFHAKSKTASQIQQRTKTVPSYGTNALIILVHVFSGLASEKKAECRGKNGASNAEHQRNVICC
jgi:hypothetical protein